METYSRLFTPDLIRQLVATGFLPVHAQDAAITHPAPPWLKISQDGDPLDSTAFDLDCGAGTGCILDLHVAVDLSAFSIWRWELDLPWKDPKFQWVPEPPEGKFPDNVYQIPGCERLIYPWDQVINHRHKLQRGHGLDGLLLGFSFESIPDYYRHGENIDARLVLINDMERSFSKPVQLYVDRSAKINRQRGEKKNRRRLLDQLVYGEDVLKNEEEVLIQT